jgi:preprotein translocase subunit SecD
MRSLLNWLNCMILLLSASVLQAQSQLSIHAASAAPVEGWQRMQVEHSDRVVWVSPTAAISAGDIEQATAAVTRRTRWIAITLTDVGAWKARNLSIEQRNKLVALVVDNKVLSVWAPNAQSEFTKESALIGNAPTGLTQEEVARIMSILQRDQLPPPPFSVPGWPQPK